jgi:hypothetical protein
MGSQVLASFVGNGEGENSARVVFAVSADRRSGSAPNLGGKIEFLRRVKEASLGKRLLSTCRLGTKLQMRPTGLKMDKIVLYFLRLVQTQRKPQDQ